MKRILTITVLLLIFAFALTSCGGSDKKEETVYDILADTFEKTFNSQNKNLHLLSHTTIKTFAPNVPAIFKNS